MKENGYIFLTAYICMIGLWATGITMLFRRLKEAQNEERVLGKRTKT